MDKCTGFLLLLTIISLLLMPALSYTDAEYSSNRYHILIECVEEYSSGTSIEE